MMMTINLEKTLIAKEEKSYENSLSELEAKDTVSRWYDDTALGAGPGKFQFEKVHFLFRRNITCNRQKA